MRIEGVNIEFLGHAGFLISTNSKKIIIDPYNISDNVPKADLILITHSHYDHCSIKDIEKVYCSPCKSQKHATAYPNYTYGPQCLYSLLRLLFMYRIFRGSSGCKGSAADYRQFST